ncbi:IclR family transcriptional regulator [Nakamurella leprariae]|uniref:IclR family transcriptional regulator n=1 Tax=Nakamurella leprariae TaxID=2803911 RepID=A0A938Y9V6_9ACTN|nr:IclR family transcriptional regulator [Nakamurella leprariae]MBM9468540.1 IclR family transcriptional regulator [Nakamurella leprariae]
MLRHTRAAVEALAHAGALPPADLARRLGVPRPSVYRLLTALAHEGLVVPSADGSFALGTRWLGFGEAALRSASSWFDRDDLLEELRDRTGLTVFLSVPRPDRTVCIRRLHGRSYKILVLRPGGSLPLHLGGVGRISLAFGPQDADEYLDRAPFDPVTEHSLVTRPELEADIETSQATGATVSDQDVTIGVAAIAVPVLDGGALLAALSVAGRREDILGRVDVLRRSLTEAAGQMGSP